MRPFPSGHSSRFSTLLVLLACLSPFVFERPASAAWAPGGNPITNGFQSTFTTYTAASDGQSGAFVVWSQPVSSSGFADSIWCVHVLPDGNLAPGWPAGGRRVCAAPASCGVEAAPDGSGGAYISFVRSAFGGAHDLFLVRMTPEGTVAPGWPADGLLLSDAPNPKIAIVAGDGLGGAGVCWQLRSDDVPLTPAHNDIYAARVLSGGALAPGWPAGGVAVKVAPPTLQVANGLHHHRMAADGSGGFYLAWIDSFSTTDDVYVQRLAADGSIAPGWPAGGRTACAVLSEKGQNGQCPLLACDGFGGAYVGWMESRSGRVDGYVMRIAGDGSDAPGWPADGLVPCAGSYAGGLFGLDADGAGGAVLGYDLAQYDPLPPTLLSSIGVCRIDAGGDPEPGWPAGGVPVTDTLSLRQGLWLAGDGGGGARVLWSNSVSDISQPRATRVEGSGAIAAGWPELGKPLTPSPTAKSLLRVVPDSRGGEIAFWVEGTGPYEVYGQRLGSDGNATTDVPLQPRSPDRLAAAPNPFHAGVDLSLTLPRAGEAQVIVCDLAGRRVRTLARGALAAGPHRFAWDGRSDAGLAQPPGIYLVRARAPEFEAQRKIVRLR